MALAFLRGLGCEAVATEVRCPISRFRVDVAGYLDTLPPSEDGYQRGRGRRRCEPRTVLIECKRSREDFLRDGREADRLVAARDELDRIRRHIEEGRIKACEPHLRRSGTSLFPELEEWDFSASRLRGYRHLLRRMRRLEQKIHGETKFFMIARYRLADRLYLAAPRGMIQRRELPSGWGLLECSRRRLGPPAFAIDGAAGAPLGIAVEAPKRASRPEHRIRLLRNIAVAACRRHSDVKESAVLA
jgi:hypothetical protein